MFQVILKVRFKTIFELNHQTVIWLFSLMSFWNFWVFKHRRQELSISELISWAHVELFSSGLMISDCSRVYLHHASSHPLICTLFNHNPVIPLGNYTAPLWLRDEEMTTDSHPLLFSPQLGPGDAALDERHFYSKIIHYNSFDISLSDLLSALLEKACVFSQSSETQHHIAEIRDQKCNEGIVGAQTSQL